MSKSNVAITSENGSVCILIKSRYRVLRPIAILLLVTYSWFMMVAIALMTMSMALEYGVDDTYRLIMTPIFVSSALIPHCLAAIMLAVLFTKETITVSADRVLYRFSLFGIGPTRSYPHTHVAFDRIRPPFFRNNLLFQFLGLSKSTFRLLTAKKTRLILDDVKRVDTDRIAAVLESHGLTDSV